MVATLVEAKCRIKKWKWPFLRAAASIALNLSEGNAKWSVKEKKRFCQTILRLLHNPSDEVDKLLDQLGVCIFRLLRSENQNLEMASCDIAKL